VTRTILPAAPGSRIFVGAGSFCKRQFFADDRAQRAIFEACDDTGVNLCFFGCGNGPKREGADGAAACHEVTSVDADFTLSFNAEDHVRSVSRKAAAY
jgi:hypothetical protein